MVEITPIAPGFHVRQRATPPMVYFDNWAWRKFSESQPLQTRFINALKLRNGTLALSWFGLAEFSILKDPRHGRNADRLFEAAFPNVFFLHSNFFRVAQAEEEGLPTDISSPPYADDGFFGEFMKLRLSRGPIGLHELSQTDGIRLRLNKLLADIVAQIESLRKESENSQQSQRIIERYRAYPGRHYATGFMLRELLLKFMRNKTLEVTTNHAADLSHAVVPASYCQYVLLDAHWETQVNQARKRLESAGISLPFAEAFSEKHVEHFLKEFAK